ncbi:MAG TPA: BON domain-containing protein [Candidatus Binataceae bacterium]|nr:BON domain-containing protein [Candidatus Binataceae bacterium]
MKKCPRCNKSYPDTETFCEADGTALVKGGPAFTQGQGGKAQADPGAGGIECPVCGGIAQPGELICNYCGARLADEGPAAQTAAPAKTAPSPRTAVSPRSGPIFSDRLTGKVGPDGSYEDASDRSALPVAGYILAALIALGGGAWLALHLGSKPAEGPRAEASPVAAIAAASPVASPIPSVAPSPVPMVSLAAKIFVQTTGDSASQPERNQDAAHKAFEANKNTLLNTYIYALSADSTLADAMVVRIRVLPDGTVSEAAVRTSTNPNPSLDAEVVKDFSAWNFPRIANGTADMDFPVIFSTTPVTADALESQLLTKLSGLGPTEPPEYASAAPSPAAPTAVETPPPAASAEPPPRKRKIARTAPTPTLQQRVKEALHSNPKLRRVDCYTSGSTVTIFGKVFDANTKILAERVVGRVPGVGNVVDSLTTDEGDWARRQNQIAAQLAGAGLTGVTIKVIGHDAFLGGTVKTDLQKQQAVTITESAAPVTVRTNLITVLPGSVFGF